MLKLLMDILKKLSVGTIFVSNRLLIHLLHARSDNSHIFWKKEEEKKIKNNKEKKNLFQWDLI